MPLLSMTGLGRGRGQHGALALAVEMRSVNHKFLDARIRLPSSLGVLEGRALALARTRVERGRLDITVNVEAGSTLARPQLDEALAANVVEGIRALGSRLGLPGALTVSDLAGMHELFIRPAAPADEDEAWPALQAALEAAFADLDQMRAQEGAALVADLHKRLALVEELAGRVEARLPGALDELQKRLRARVLELAADVTVEPARLAQECALLAERTDVAEEMTRLKSHVAQFRKLLDGKEPAGRKLDFLCQELHREANTTTSKAQDAGIQALVVDLKAEIERIREQVQNIT